MVFNVLLYISLGIFILGLIYKIYTWFSMKIGISAQDYTPAQRFLAAIKELSELYSVQKYFFSLRPLFWTYCCKKGF